MLCKNNLWQSKQSGTASEVCLEICHSEKWITQGNNHSGTCRQTLRTERCVYIKHESLLAGVMYCKAKAIFQIGSVGPDLLRSFQFKVTNWMQDVWILAGFLSLSLHSDAQQPAGPLLQLQNRAPINQTPKVMELNPVYPYALFVTRKSNEHVGGKAEAGPLRNSSKQFSL